jgi:choline dehydrogenase
LQALYEAVTFSRTILNHVISLDGGFTEIWPGPEFTTEESIKDYVRNETYSGHGSGTCAIGADDDPNAVLDSKFRVRGVAGLGVVDSSVFPVVPATNVMVPTYIVSEKAADDILDGW